MSCETPEILSKPSDQFGHRKGDGGLAWPKHVGNRRLRLNEPQPERPRLDQQDAGRGGLLGEQRPKNAVSLWIPCRCNIRQAPENLDQHCSDRDLDDPRLSEAAISRSLEDRGLLPVLPGRSLDARDTQHCALVDEADAVWGA